MRLERQVSEQERSQLLDRMASPDYQCMTSVPGHGVPLSVVDTDQVIIGQDGYLAPDVIVNTNFATNNGYLVPNVTINSDNEDVINNDEDEEDNGEVVEMRNNATLPSNVKLTYTKV